MNNRPLLAGVFLLSLALASCGATERDVGNSILKLPECADSPNVFPGVGVDAVVSSYHAAVGGVIDAHMNDLTDINTRPLQCTANDYRELLKPSAALVELANKLPEWGPSRASELSEVDLGSVLLEHLRVYECTLLEKSEFLGVSIVRDQGESQTLPDESEVKTMDRGDLLKEQQRQGEIIRREMATARPALERTIAFLGGVDRLRPLSAELECLKRASLDLRNATGLMAEAASCMPKIWDARGSLRDLSE